MIDLIVLCVTLFGSQENVRKIFYFVLRLLCLRKFNMRKLRGMRKLCTDNGEILIRNAIRLVSFNPENN